MIVLNCSGESYHFILNSTILSMGSAVDARIQAGDTHSFNGVGGDAYFRAGDGLNPSGGSGGAIHIRADEGKGQEAYGGKVGNGGSVEIGAGSSVEGCGGNFTATGGSSAAGDGGDVHILSGASASGRSGRVVVASPTVEGG